MDIKDLTNVSRVVINSLLMVLKQNDVDVDSISMQLSASNGDYVSDEVNLGELAQQTLEKLKATPEGFVLEQKNWISVEIGTPAKFGTRVKIKRKSWDEEDNLVFTESEATYDKDSDFCELSNRSYEYETWFDHSLNKYLEEDELTHWMPLSKKAQEQSHD